MRADQAHCTHKKISGLTRAGLVELDVGESRPSEEHRFVAQNKEPDIAFRGGKVRQVGRLRRQWFAITIESGGLKLSAIADEMNGVCSSSGRHGALGDARSRRSS